MPNLKNNFLPLLIIVIIGSGIYANSLPNSFVYDDLVTVEENLFIRDWENLGKFLSADYYSRSEEYSFRPLVTITYFSDYALFALKPWGYHLTNLILHLLAGITLYFLSKKFLDGRVAPLLASLIFIVHPVQTEAVNGISFREDLLCCLFFSLSLLIYISSERLKKRVLNNGQYNMVNAETKTNPSLLVLSILFFLLALLSKEMAVTFPLVILAYEVILRKERLTVLFRPKIIILFLISGIYFIARFLLLFQQGTLPAAPEFGNIFTRLFLVLKGIGLYGRLVFFPVSLTVEYADPFPPVVWSNYLLIPALLTTALLIFVWVRRNHHAASAFGLAFFFITLLPVLNLVPNSRLGAERFAYLPMLGISLWGGAVLSGIWFSSKRRTITTLLIGLIFLSLGAGTVSRNLDWMDNLPLFTRAVAVSPLSSKAHHGLGNELFRIGRLGEAVNEFDKAIEIFPREPLYYNSLGVAYGEMGRFDEALIRFQASARLNPGDPLVLMNLSTLFLRTGDIPRARETINKFIAARPFDPDGYINLGEIELQIEAYRSAITALQMALDRDPNSLPALSNLGYCYYRLGEMGQAEKYWRAALALDPNNPGLKRNLKIISGGHR
jgi:protein O-mannosyl-transferase